MLFFRRVYISYIFHLFSGWDTRILWFKPCQATYIGAEFSDMNYKGLSQDSVKVSVEISSRAKSLPRLYVKFLKTKKNKA